MGRGARAPGERDGIRAPSGSLRGARQNRSAPAIERFGRAAPRSGGRPGYIGRVPAPRLPSPARHHPASRQRRAAIAPAAVASVVVGLLTAIPCVARAQATWGGKAQLSGNVLFGTSDQRVVGTVAELVRRDSTVEFDASGSLTYGDARLSGDRREVAKRTLLGGLSADWRPYAAVSPFVALTAESNLEKRIDGRYAIAIGAKRTFVLTEEREISLSAAVLDEYTVPARPPATTAGPAPRLPSERTTRWSLRGRIRHQFDARLRASHVTFWQPAINLDSRYLVRSTTEAQYALTERFGLTASLQYNYDSEAVRRGARVGYDGQALVGIAAGW